MRHTLIPDRTAGTNCHRFLSLDRMFLCDVNVMLCPWVVFPWPEGVHQTTEVCRIITLSTSSLIPRCLIYWSMNSTQSKEQEWKKEKQIVDIRFYCTWVRKKYSENFLIRYFFHEFNEGVSLLHSLSLSPRLLTNLLL